MAKMIQVELNRVEAESTRVTVTWVPLDLKLKVGDTITDGATKWQVAIVYPLLIEERDGGSPWRKQNS